MAAEAVVADKAAAEAVAVVDEAAAAEEAVVAAEEEAEEEAVAVAEAAAVVEDAIRSIENAHRTTMRRRIGTLSRTDRTIAHNIKVNPMRPSLRALQRMSRSPALVKIVALVVVAEVEAVAEEGAEVVAAEEAVATAAEAVAEEAPAVSSAAWPSGLPFVIAISRRWPIASRKRLSPRDNGRSTTDLMKSVLTTSL